VVLLGREAGQAWRQGLEQAAAGKSFIAIELDTECLGVHTGEDEGPANVVGFARFRLGDDAPTNLVELVKKSYTDAAAVQAAKSAFEAAGLVVAVCNDFPGRILNRLLRPYYNAALRRLDEGLASAADMDKTLCLGLGYPEGPIALLKRSGLHHHYRVTQALYEALGQEAYAPARRAQVAWARHRTAT
jgi:3-hydroxybutyryl-CoA dehydrogenase